MCTMRVMNAAAIDLLQSDLAGVCGHLNALQASLARLVADALEGDAWAQWGIHTPTHWLSWQAGLTDTTARKLVAVAEARRSHPVTWTAFEAGELSLDQVAIAVKVPAWADRQTCTHAKTMTVSQLSRVVRRYPFGAAETHGAAMDAAEQARRGNPQPAAEGEPEPAPQRSPTAGPAPAAVAADPRVVDSQLSLWLDEHGSGHLRGSFAADQFRIIDAALREARDALFQAGHTDVGWADALVEVANRSLDKAPAARRDRFRVNLFIDVDGTATWGDGWAVPDGIRQHLGCDGTLSPVFRENSHPVDVGHSQHIVPDRTRRLVEHRDRGCRVPGCAQSRWIQVHHIIHWDHHGPTDTWNLICLCPKHHRMHHRGRLGITGNADLPADQPAAVSFTDQHGRTLPGCGKPAPPTGPPPTPDGRYIHPLGERLDYDAVYYNPPRHPAA